MMPYRREIDRGVTVLQQQVRELATDVAELKGQAVTWQQTHERTHLQDKRDRTSERHWMIGTAIAGLVALCTVIGLLITLLAQLGHHR